MYHFSHNWPNQWPENRPNQWPEQRPMAGGRSLQELAASRQRRRWTALEHQELDRLLTAGFGPAQIAQALGFSVVQVTNQIRNTVRRLRRQSER
jgi:hypothetical protein